MFQNLFVNFRKIKYKDLTAISCPIKALNSFTNAHYETHSSFSQRLEEFVTFKKISLKVTKFFKNYKILESKP